MLPPDHLLRLQVIHQRFHRYIPYHNFVRWVDKNISDRPSCSRDLTDAALISHMDALYPQKLPWRLWTPPRELVSLIASTLRKMTPSRDSLLVDPSPPMGTGQKGPSYIKKLTTTSYSSSTGIRSLSLTTLQVNTGQDPLLVREIIWNRKKIGTA